jgi:hypothetical protein
MTTEETVSSEEPAFDPDALMRILWQNSEKNPMEFCNQQLFPYY